MKILSNIALLTLSVGLFSCSGNVKENQNKETIVEEEIIVVKDSINEVVNPEELSTIEKPRNVVTQEFWEQFDTDINGVVFFTKLDSTFQNHGYALSSIQEKANGVALYKFYTNDNYAQLYLNDSLAFDITPFLLEHDEGFVLLKPHTMPTYVSSDNDDKQLIDDVVSFFH